jgi:gamma-glutamyltranspeptidase/glutathione hydrolase
LLCWIGVFCTQIQAQSEIGKNIIASATPEATETGALVFDKGGNAVDAAVAVAFTLGVTEPAMSGIGGRTMLMLSIPKEDPIAIGGISLTPSHVDENIERKNLNDYKQVAIPSQLKVLDYVWRHYGSGNLKWEELLQPAIQYAEEGFINGLHRHHVFRIYQNRLKNSPFHNRELLIDGEIPAVGDVIKQPTLAHTLKRIATHGADDFYKGKIAKEMANDFKAHDGWITYEDLYNFPEPEEYKPLQTKYRGYDVYSFVPPGGGWQIIQALNLFELYSPEDLKPNTIKRVFAVLNVLNLSHNDRLDNPIQDYTDYKKEIKKKISKAYAKKLFNTAVEKQREQSSTNEDETGETTHFSVVDKNGIAVSVTSSIGSYFGSRTSTKSLGFFYNSYIKSILGFGLGKKLQPNTNIPSSMSPSLVKKDGRNVLIIGTPGSKRIVSTISQLIQLWVDSDMKIKDIVQKPRFHAIRHKAYIENTKITAQELQKIRNEGFKIAFPSYSLTKANLNAYFGGVHAVEFKNGQWNGAADNRRDGNVYKN